MKHFLKQGLCIGLAAALLSGCARSAKEESSAADIPEPSSAPVVSVSSQEASQREIPPELLAWVEGSGWDIPPEMFAQHSMPAADSIAPDYPAEYLIETQFHRHERQQGNSCGGYASAYLLRTLGVDVSGQEVYDRLDYKITAGLVLPQGILNYLDAAGYPATLYQGNLEQLKTRLHETGHPIVVLVGSGMEYQHYIALVGYDEKQLYFFDSNQPENPDAIYNSVLSNAEFASLWENIIPGFERIYIVAEG